MARSAFTQHRSPRIALALLRLSIVVAVLCSALGLPLHTIAARNLAAVAARAQPPADVVAVTAGHGHTCVLTNGGRVSCWGDNAKGQSDVPADLGAVVQISAGLNHTCAVTDAGVLRCWGGNTYQQATAPADLGPVRQVSVGSEVTCVLTRAETVRCWGIPVTMQHNVPPDLGPVSSMQASVTISQAGATCAVTRTGQVRCWGSTARLDQVSVPTDLNAVSAVSVGGEHACVLVGGNGLRCWGSDSFGQTPPPSDLGAVRQVSAGFDHTCAITEKGELRCWGDNDHGQASVPAALGAVRQVSAGFWHTCAVTDAGAVRCWGSDEKGQLGAASAPHQAANSPAKGEIAYLHNGNIYLLDLASGQARALVSDGTVGMVTNAGNTQLAWSPDGQRLAYASKRAGNYDIYTIEVASGKAEQISNAPVDEYLPSFAPDGTLFFVRIDSPYIEPDSNGTSRNVLVRRSPAGKEENVYPPQCEIFSISARSTTSLGIAYGCHLTQGDAGIIDVSAPPAGDPRPESLLEKVCKGLVAYRANDIKWSPDRSMLATIWADCPASDEYVDWRNAIFIVDPARPNESARRVIGNQQSLTTLDWSPDANWLVYGQQKEWDRGSRDPEGIWIVSANGGEPQRISAVGTNPAWRPVVGGGAVVPTVAPATQATVPTQSPQPTVAAPPANSAVSYVFSGRVTNESGNPVPDILISGDTCGSTTTDKDGDFILIWNATEPTPCSVRPYQKNVPQDAWGAVFDPPAYTFLTQGTEKKDFTMRSERRPLIFVPGIMGSYLYEMIKPFPEERWPGVGDAKRNLDGHALRLDIEPVPNIIATDAIGMYKVPFFKAEDIYGTLFIKLLREGYDGSHGILGSTTPLQKCRESWAHTNLFTFAYDWRKSNAENANNLQEYIDCVRERTGSKYVDVVAHSMGGLLTRRYILNPPHDHHINRFVSIATGIAGVDTTRALTDDHHIDRFVSIATPWLGAPKAIAIMETGDYPGITPKVILQMQLKSVAASSPGAHELLPSPTYFDRVDKTFTEGGWDYNQNGGIYETYTFQVFAEALDRRFDSKPASRGRDFHTTQQDDLSEWYGVEHYNFYGNIKDQDTITNVRSTRVKTCVPVRSFPLPSFQICRDEPYLASGFGDGDGTVPVISAVPDPLQEPPTCNADNVRVACFYGDKDHVDHGALVRNDAVLSTLIDVLARRKPVVPGTNSSGRGDDDIAYSTSFSAASKQASSEAVQPAHYITLLNAPSATLANARGNTTDTISGTLSVPVPNASYYILGEQAHMFVAPADQSYSITLPVGLEPMYMELRTGTGQTTSNVVRYSDLSFPLTTTAQLSIPAQGSAELRYDSDGDGSFDATVPATASVSGAAASDVEPPTVSISVDAQGMATIVAEDRASGVKQVLYSTDDVHYQIYRGPFAVDRSAATTLYAFADDNAANRSGVQKYAVARADAWGWPFYAGLGAVGFGLLGGAFVAGRRIVRPLPRRWAVLGLATSGVGLLLFVALRIPSLLSSAGMGAQPPSSTAALATAAPNASGPGLVLPSVPPAATSALQPSATLALPASAAPAPGSTGLVLPSVPPAATNVLQPTVTLALPSNAAPGTQIPSSTVVASPAPRAPFAVPPVVPRATWGAAEPRGELTQQTPARIILTHDTRSCCDGVDTTARVRSTQSAHMESSGWPDIAYHYVVAPDGSIFAGRAPDRRGNSSYAASNPGYQLDGSLVIGVLGNYDTQTPTPAALRSITWLMAWLCQAYAIAPDDIYSLAQVAPADPWIGQTTSPGRNMPAITVFQGKVRAILAGEQEP